MLPSMVIILADIILTIRDCYKGRIDAKTRNKLIKAKLAKGGINLAIGAILTVGLMYASGGLLIGVAAGGIAISIAVNASLDYVAAKKVSKKVKSVQEDENRLLYLNTLKCLEMPPDCTDEQLTSAKRKKLVMYNPDSKKCPASSQKEFTEKFITVLAAYQIAHNYRLENGIGEEALSLKKLASKHEE